VDDSIMAAMCADLDAEQSELAGSLVGRSEAEWAESTPAEGWTVRDQIAHLAYFDEKAVLAHIDPERFTAELAGLLESGDLGALERAHIVRGRQLSGSGVLGWWNEARRELIDTYRELESRTQIIWYGPPMSARSKITARIMETFAHGQDIRDALGVKEIPTGRLRHVCHIGVRAMSWSFQVNDVPPPTGPVHVALASPAGDVWRWGDEAAEDRVTGGALDFALLVTQRRHRDDLALVADGPVADRWLDMAQAFAGPPGPGRRPGQFA
jgi:uncharacterized protein (TIGR03084 family)